MFCISVREPWATAIFSLGKNVENRTWRTHHRGQLWIHTSTADVARRDIYALKLSMRDLFPLGYIVDTVELYGITRSSRSRWAQEGQWHWLIRNPVLIDPMRWRGRVGLFRADVTLD